MAESPISTFISYSRADSAFIDRLEADLRAYGFDTWVDRQHLEGGADWARVIEMQIQQRETLVVALSPDAITSTWVRREITFALNGGKYIIPIIARPVASTPIEIVNLQYIDLSADYTSGLQELRVALLKTRSLPPPPRPAQAPLPLLTLPDVSDPLKGLVEIPAPPPAPNPDRNALFMQAQAALAHSNFDLAEALLGQLVEQEADFGSGLAGEELQRVRKQLEPERIQRLLKLAEDAHASGAWGQEIGALRAIVLRLPHDSGMATRLALAEECQRWAWLYDNAIGFAHAGDEAATQIALVQLWSKASYFGDPSHIAPHGLTPPEVSRDDEPSVLVPFNEAPRLIVKEPKERTITITRVPFTIGRRNDNDLVVEDGTVAAAQAVIFRHSNGEFGIQARNDTHGVYVNGKRLRLHRLLDGDEIKIGAMTMSFQAPSSSLFQIFKGKL
ncbi:MAG: TIR domain-containing protein [Ktedonobacterales bacterium]